MGNIIKLKPTKIFLETFYTILMAWRQSQGLLSVDSGNIREPQKILYKT